MTSEQASTNIRVPVPDFPYLTLGKISSTDVARGLGLESEDLTGEDDPQSLQEVTRSLCRHWKLAFPEGYFEEEENGHKEKLEALCEDYCHEPKWQHIFQGFWDLKPQYLYQGWLKRAVKSLTFHCNDHLIKQAKRGSQASRIPDKALRSPSPIMADQPPTPVSGVKRKRDGVLEGAPCDHLISHDEASYLTNFVQNLQKRNGEFQELRRKLHQTEEETARLQTELRSQKDYYEQALARKDTEYAQKVRELGQENSQLQTRVFELDKRQSESANTVGQLQKQNDELKQSSNEMEAGINALASRRDQLEKAKDSLETEMERKLKDAKNAYTNLEGQIKKLREEKAEAERERNKALQDLQDVVEWHGRFPEGLAAGSQRRKKTTTTAVALNARR